jgi:hypothetical protein
MRFHFAEGRIAEIEVIGNQATLAELDLALMD